MWGSVRWPAWPQLFISCSLAGWPVWSPVTGRTRPQINQPALAGRSGADDAEHTLQPGSSSPLPLQPFSSLNVQTDPRHDKDKEIGTLSLSLSLWHPILKKKIPGNHEKSIPAISPSLIKPVKPDIDDLHCRCAFVVAGEKRRGERGGGGCGPHVAPKNGGVLPS